VAFPFLLRPVLLLATIFYLTFVSRIIIVPLLPILEGEFGLGHAGAGSLFLFVAAGYCVGLFSSPFISSLLNHRRTIILSALLVGGAVIITSQSASVSAMRAGLLLIGVCAGFYMPSGVALLTELVIQRHWGKAMSIHELAPNLAFVTAPLLVEALLRWMPWRTVIAGVGFASILAGVVFRFAGPGGNRKGERPNLKAIGMVLGEPAFWVMGATFCLCVGGSLGVFTMLPLYLVDDLGFERELANGLIGASRVLATAVLFLAGVIADRVGYERATFGFLAGMGALTLALGFFRGPLVTPVLVFLHPITAVSVFPAVMALVPGFFPPGLRSLGMSLVILIGFLVGGGLIPQMIGYLAERFSFSFGFFILSIVIFAFLPFLLLLRGRDVHVPET
jgi:NNP family nitrate/nitrite transporter-like MFS transporter